MPSSEKGHLCGHTCSVWGRCVGSEAIFWGWWPGSLVQPHVLSKVMAQVYHPTCNLHVLIIREVSSVWMLSMVSAAIVP